MRTPPSLQHVKMAACFLRLGFLYIYWFSRLEIWGQEEEKLKKEIKTMAEKGQAASVTVPASTSLGSWHWTLLEIVTSSSSAGLPREVFSHKAFAHIDEFGWYSVEFVVFFCAFYFPMSPAQGRMRLWTTFDTQSYFVSQQVRFLPIQPQNLHKTCQ